MIHCGYLQTKLQVIFKTDMGLWKGKQWVAGPWDINGRLLEVFFPEKKGAKYTAESDCLTEHRLEIRGCEREKGR